MRRLAARGARIRVISRDPAHGTHLQPMGSVGQIVVERADLTSGEALARVVEGALAVVNLIGVLYETRRQTFAEVQGELPGRIARAAAATGGRRKGRRLRRPFAFMVPRRGLEPPRPCGR